MYVPIGFWKAAERSVPAGATRPSAAGEVEARVGTNADVKWLLSLIQGGGVH